MQELTKMVIFLNQERRRQYTPEFFHYCKQTYNLFGFMAYLVRDGYVLMTSFTLVM